MSIEEDQENSHHTTNYENLFLLLFMPLFNSKEQKQFNESGENNFEQNNYLNARINRHRSAK